MLTTVFGVVTGKPSTIEKHLQTAKNYCDEFTQSTEGGIFKRIFENKEKKIRIEFETDVTGKILNGRTAITYYVYVG